MRKNAVFLLSLALAGMSCAQTKQVVRVDNLGVGTRITNLEPLYWLADDWVLLRNGQPSRTYESWKYINDSLFQAVSFTVRPGGDTVFAETIALAIQADGLYYIPIVKGQNDDKPVPFRLTGQEDDAWVFENPAHDFPRQIKYALAGYDTLHAQVSAPGKEINFTFLRKPRIQRFELPGEDGPVVMRKFWLLSYLVGPYRSQSKEEAAQIQAGHLGHLSAIYHAGKSCVAGPTDGVGEVRGFVVFTTATREEAVHLAHRDPAVKAGRLTFRIDPWWAMEGAVLK